MDTTYQRLTDQDAALLQSLIVLLGDVFKDPDYTTTPPSEAYLQQFLANPANIVLVALDGYTVIGGLVAYHLTKFEKERSEVYLYDLAVANEYQRGGVGAELLNELKNVAKSLGAYVVFVQADDGDAAVEFYRAQKPTGEIRAINFDFDV
jgi:aminoglycoside 3-N-acetyltransferase I